MCTCVMCIYIGNISRARTHTHTHTQVSIGGKHEVHFGDHEMNLHGLHQACILVL